MENKIKVLPESVANQIAAGEVVQRPASAVKELLENALDSGASKITLHIKEAGKSLIQVIDNGQGMSEMDARLSVERHATSKISQLEDIFKIHTMGFRGEALASIAAVSQLEVKTKTKGDELASVIKMKGSEIEQQKFESGNQGTSITVKNLFFNVPARRNFLKSNGVENRHINDVFQQVALSSPDVSFSYINNDEEIYRLDKSNFKQRIIQLFGKRFNERLIPISEETEIVKLSGFVGKPEFATSKRNDQFFLVNGRFIKSPYLHHGLMSAFEDLLSKEMHPAYFVNLEVDPAQIDINIHPTKTEIKFLEERSIYAIMRTTVRQSLGKFNISPTLDFERETAFDNVSFDKNKSIKIPEISVDKDYDPFKSGSVLVQRENQPERSSLSNKNSLEDFFDTPKETKIESPPPTSIQSTMNDDDDQKSDNGSKIIQLHNKFILTHIKSGIMIIDQHRAHQRVIYEKFLSRGSKSISSQKLLFPVLIEMKSDDISIAKEIISDLEKLGFSIEDFGKDSISINGIPPGCPEKEVKSIFLSILDNYNISGEKEGGAKMDKLMTIVASSMAIKSGQKLQEREMKHLIDELFACEMPYALPNGKPTIITLSLDELGKKFQYR